MSLGNLQTDAAEVSLWSCEGDVGCAVPDANHISTGGKLFGIGVSEESTITANSCDD
jgi:hypothetical protein